MSNYHYTVVNRTNGDVVFSTSTKRGLTSWLNSQAEIALPHAKVYRSRDSRPGSTVVLDVDYVLEEDSGEL